MVIDHSGSAKVLRDNHVSAKAKAVWAYLDVREGEHVTLDAICIHFMESEQTLRKAIHELEEKGYLRRERYSLKGHAAYNWYLL